jgi:hypothetical protein
VDPATAAWLLLKQARDLEIRRTRSCNWNSTR